MIPIHQAEEILVRPIKLSRLSFTSKYNANEPHRHLQFEFFIFEQGGGSHLIDFQEFEITPFCIQIVAPGQIHQIKRAVDSSGYAFLFEARAMAAFPVISDFLFDHICFGIRERSPHYAFSVDIQQEIDIIMRNVWSNVQRQTAQMQTYFAAAIAQLCVYCINNLKDEPVNAEHKNQPHYRSFRHLLKDNFKQLKKVKDYAKELNISEKMLNEICLSFSGLNASTLIYNQIILEGKRLLRTGITAKETAYALEFEDPAHFSKFFKSQTGLSPTDFQKIQV